MTDKSKIALITGATSGFGVVIARHLVKQGYSLIVLGRSKDKLDSLILDLKKVNSKEHSKELEKKLRKSFTRHMTIVAAT